MDSSTHRYCHLNVYLFKKKNDILGDKKVVQIPVNQIHSKQKVLVDILKLIIRAVAGKELMTFIGAPSCPTVISAGFQRQYKIMTNFSNAQRMMPCL